MPPQAVAFHFVADVRGFSGHRIHYIGKLSNVALPLLTLSENVVRLSIVVLPRCVIVSKVVALPISADVRVFPRFPGRKLAGVCDRFSGAQRIHICHALQAVAFHFVTDVRGFSGHRIHYTQAVQYL